MTGDSTDRKNELRHTRQKTSEFRLTTFAAFTRSGTGR